MAESWDYLMYVVMWRAGLDVCVEGAEDITLRGADVGEDSWSCHSACCPSCWGNWEPLSMMKKCPDHLVALKDRAEVNEMGWGDVAWWFQTLEEGVEETRHSVVWPSSGPVGELLGVQLWSDSWQDVFRINHCLINIQGHNINTTYELLYWFKVVWCCISRGKVV